MTSAGAGSSLTPMTIDTATHFRIAPLEVLITELEEHASDRTTQGKHEKAAAARRAAAELRDGDRRTFFNRCWWIVGDEAKHYSAYAGSRDEVIATLHDASEGWARFGKMPLAFDARAAAGAVAAGADSVQVGHLVYEVIA